MIEKASPMHDAMATTSLPPKHAGDAWHDILLCYLYTRVPEGEVQRLAEWLERLCATHAAIGRVLVSNEGINVNLACASGDGAIDCVCDGLRMHRLLGGHPTRSNTIDFKVERRATPSPPFPDLAVKVVKEIVPTAGDMPVELLDTVGGGTHLSPEQFHQVLVEHGQAPGPTGAVAAATPAKDLVIIDVRNRKEMQFGHFEGAISSDTKMFSEWATHFADPHADTLRDKKVLMYCTGGVRCEKASAYLRSKGVQDVSQLSGGIHRYLERYGADGQFLGSNMVFDGRGLQRPKGAAVIAHCYSCGQGNEEMSSDRVCAVCRDSVVVCDGCRVQHAGVYFCDVHAGLAGVYFPFLDGFTVAQLQAQRDALVAMCADGAEYGGPVNANRRRSINKQLKKLERALQQAAAVGPGQGKAAETPPKCRSCGRVCASLLALMAPDAALGADDSACDGRCWGFFQKVRRKEGYVDIFKEP